MALTKYKRDKQGGDGKKGGGGGSSGGGGGGQKSGGGGHRRGSTMPAPVGAGVSAAVEVGAGVGRQFQRQHRVPQRQPTVRRVQHQQQPHQPPPPASPLPGSPQRKTTVASSSPRFTVTPSGTVTDPLARSSMRSKASSASCSGGSSGKGSQQKDKRKACKDCCRAAVLFLFTQVGVGGMVVVYTLMGASIFSYIETLPHDPSIEMAAALRTKTVEGLWGLTKTFNVLNKDGWNREVNETLRMHQMGIVKLIKEHGYDERTPKQRWSFSASLMFALSVISMIGYGDVVPRSKAGRISTIVYACFGIPVYILYFMNMGKVLAAVLKWVYTKAYRWNVKRKWKQSMNYDEDGQEHHDMELDEAYLDELEAQVIVPSTTCLYVMVSYLLLGTVMFAEWEQWDYLDSVYFCVTSLLKIGFGDFVPGTHAALEGQVDTPETQAKLVITFVYLLVGMGVVAMCYYLLREEVTVRFAQFKNRMKLRIERFKARFRKTNVNKPQEQQEQAQMQAQRQTNLSSA